MIRLRKREGKLTLLGRRVTISIENVTFSPRETCKPLRRGFKVIDEEGGNFERGKKFRGRAQPWDHFSFDQIAIYDLEFNNISE